MLAVGAKSDDPYLARVLRANKYYQITGIAIQPWEIDEVIPEDWMEAVLAIIDDIPAKTPKKDN